MIGSSVEPRIRGWVESHFSDLEMLAPPDRPPAVLSAGVEVRRAIQPTISFYRYLYDTVGGGWTWTGRRLMDDETLAAKVRRPEVEVNVLWVGSVPAGLMELDLDPLPDIQLLYFGLIPEFVGKGHGRRALDWTVDRAWSFRPKRVRVQTCDLDHPNALPVYQKAGFEIFDRGTRMDPVLHGMTPPRRNGVPIPADEISPTLAADEP